ncbi:HupE/UreJ family protein [Paenibacillus naphthalenovorans]|uniref:HupE/UreJ family protein n=1 Tax=Paenibacillus naphthalenovorans TaxID=162209 RepID=UPI003D2983DC
MSKRLIRIIAAFVLLIAVQAAGMPLMAEAHIGTIGYSDIRAAGKTINYTLYLEAREVEQWVTIRTRKVIVLDPAASAPAGPIWTEQDLQRLIGESLEVTGNGEKGRFMLKSHTVEKKNGMDFVRMELSSTFDRPVQEYGIHYAFFFDLDDPQHQNFVTVHTGNQPVQMVLNAQMRDISEKISDGSGRRTMEIAVPGWLFTFRDFLVTGMLHIWTGYDHLLFLLGLLVVKQKTKAYVQILTAFTVGHSITLALSALDIVRAPLSVIEPLIALSIVFVAIENIWLKRHGYRWLVALLFGFIHGFGFADILHGALGEDYLLALFSFNLGVEVGQLAVLAVLLPALIYAARILWYPRMVYGISGIIAFMGAVWFMDRI